MVYTVLALFKWLLSTALLYGILFLGIGIWTHRLLKLPELLKSSAYTQVAFKICLCLLPLVIVTVSKDYTHFMTGAIAPPPNEEYAQLEKTIHGHLSLGLGFIVSSFFLYIFIFRESKK